MLTILFGLLTIIDIGITIVVSILIYGLTNKNGVDIDTKYLKIQITHKDEQ